MATVGFAALSLVSLAGCFPSAGEIRSKLRDASSGQIGCPPEQIVVTNDKIHSNTATWTATCQGRTYYCSAVSVSGGVQTNCTVPQQPAAPVAPAAPAADAGATTRI